MSAMAIRDRVLEMRLTYLFDPLCGWCYGASPLLAAARRSITPRSASWTVAMHSCLR